MAGVRSLWLECPETCEQYSETKVALPRSSAQVTIQGLSRANIQLCRSCRHFPQHSRVTSHESPFLGYTQPMGILRRLRRWMGTDQPMTHIVSGNTAPGFSLQSLDGKEYSLNDLLRRGPVVAAFFKVSCPVCQFTFPFLERLHKRYGGDGVTFLGISQDDARDTKDFAKEFSVTFPMLLDDENAYVVSNAYGLTNVPTIFLIDSDGAVKVTSMGFDKKDLEAIAAELAQRHHMMLAPLFRPDEIVPINKPG